MCHCLQNSSSLSPTWCVSCHAQLIWYLFVSRTCWTTRVHQAVVQGCPSSSREPWPGRSASWSVSVCITPHGPSAGWIQVSSWQTDCISLTGVIKALQVTTGKIFIQDMILNKNTSSRHVVFSYMVISREETLFKDSSPGFWRTVRVYVLFSASNRSVFCSQMMIWGLTVAGSCTSTTPVVCCFLFFDCLALVMMATFEFECSNESM